jgi:hypothetical protein
MIINTKFSSTQKAHPKNLEINSVAAATKLLSKMSAEQLADYRKRHQARMEAVRGDVMMS